MRTHSCIVASASSVVRIGKPSCRSGLRLAIFSVRFGAERFRYSKTRLSDVGDTQRGPSFFFFASTLDLRPDRVLLFSDALVTSVLGAIGWLFSRASSAREVASLATYIWAFFVDHPSRSTIVYEQGRQGRLHKPRWEHFLAYDTALVA